MAMQGDSGGPAWEFADDTHDSVLALGMISGLSGDGQLPADKCAEFAAPGFRGVCGTEGWYTSLPQAMADYQLAITKQ